MGRWNGCDLDPCVSWGWNTQTTIGEAMTYDDYDDDGSWWDVAMLPFVILALPFRLLFRLLFSTPMIYVYGVAIGICIAPFVIAIMAFKVLAVGAILTAICRSRSS